MLTLALIGLFVCALTKSFFITFLRELFWFREDLLVWNLPPRFCSGSLILLTFLVILGLDLVSETPDYVTRLYFCTVFTVCVHYNDWLAVLSAEVLRPIYSIKYLCLSPVLMPSSYDSLKDDYDSMQLSSFIKVWSFSGNFCGFIFLKAFWMYFWGFL